MNRSYFNDNGERIDIDARTPFDFMEPEPEEQNRIGLFDPLTVRFASTFNRGDFRITMLAWRFILRREPTSMRQTALRYGVSAAAISRRCRIIAQTFGLPWGDPRLRELRRDLARLSWKKRRRADRSQPAAHFNSNKKPPTKEAPHE